MTQPATHHTTPVAATIYRGASVENTHLAHVALAVLETGALERYGFDDADLALMCASHSSEPRHIERTRSMLAKARASEADLRCGGHPPLSDAVHADWIRRGFTPGGVCSNCSGKHAGMLAGARSIGAALAGYELPEHPMQVRVKQTVANVCDLPDDGVQWAIDGCNLPTPAFALDRLAHLFAKLAAAQDEVAAAQPGTAAAVSTRTAALARIYRAMTSYPELVGGEGRFCTLLMQAFGGALVGKVGADGSYAIGVRASPQTARLGAKGALGIAVKIEDGNLAALYAVTAELLALLELGTPEQRAALDGFHAPKRLNTMGVDIGRIGFSIELTAHG